MWYSYYRFGGLLKDDTKETRLLFYFDFKTYSINVHTYGLPGVPSVDLVGLLNDATEKIRDVINKEYKTLQCEGLSLSDEPGFVTKEVLYEQRLASVEARQDEQDALLDRIFRNLERTMDEVGMVTPEEKENLESQPGCWDYYDFLQKKLNVTFQACSVISQVREAHRQDN